MRELWVSWRCTAHLITASRRWSIVREVFWASTSLVLSFHSLSTWDHSPWAKEEVQMGSVNSQSVSATRTQTPSHLKCLPGPWLQLCKVRHLSSICCLSYASNIQSTSLKNPGFWKSGQPIQQNPGWSALSQIAFQSIPFLSLVPLRHAWLHLPSSRSLF